MSVLNPGTPEQDEYGPAFARYIAKARPFGDPVEMLAAQLDTFAALLCALPAEKRLHRCAPGKWSIQEMLGHIIDTERIFAYRLLRIARADATPLPGFEENGYVAAAGFEACAWDELLDEFSAVRNATLLLLRHLPEAAWPRRGTASGAPISVRALAFIIFGHVEHHVSVLLERYL